MSFFDTPFLHPRGGQRTGGFHLGVRFADGGGARRAAPARVTALLAAL